MFHTQANALRQTTQALTSQNLNATCQTLRIGKFFCLAVFSLILTTGCSSFERDWKSAQQYAYPCNDISGIWEGTWHSDHNGHEGKLRAIITKQGDNYYYAQFKASYAVVIPFGFELPLTVSDDGGVYALDGSADLGWLAGGAYSYNGQATPAEFYANYCAENDHGTFQMTRIWTCNQCYNDDEPVAEYDETSAEPVPAAD